ncbi:MAG: DUF945 domain-containing protein [Verrucomicrobiales bacterium]|nr:DUF945 domain-containing protein [Verrucomicrobiales bacterium]
MSPTLRNNNPSFIQARPGLSDNQLRSVAPSVFASSPLPGVSERYALVPTAQIVSRLREAAWIPVSAFEQRVRLDERRGFQKHMLRFQQADVVPARGEFTAELVLINSHDGSSAYQLHAGLFRFVCGNGMIVADTTFERVSIRHSGFTPDEVTEASLRILDQVPTITANVEKFRARILTAEEANAFARSALYIRFEDEAAWPITPVRLLEPRRREDHGDDLWHTFNRIHANLLQGGQRERGRFLANGRRVPRTRSVTGLDQNVRINKQLWELAQRLAAGETLTLAE